MKNLIDLRTMTLASAALLLALASPAVAQRADEMRGGGQHACAPDAQRICSEFIPDRAKVASCLFKNKRSVSAECRAELGGGKTKASGKKSGKKKKGKRRHR